MFRVNLFKCEECCYIEGFSQVVFVKFIYVRRNIFIYLFIYGDVDLGFIKYEVKLGFKGKFFL